MTARALGTSKYPTMTSAFAALHETKIATQEPIPQSIAAWPELSEQETCDRGSIAIGFGAVLDPKEKLTVFTWCTASKSRPNAEVQRMRVEPLRFPRVKPGRIFHQVQKLPNDR